MNRKSIIKHIIAEAKGNLILTEEYDLLSEISPAIKQMRGKIEKAKYILQTIKSIALRVKSGKLSKQYLEDVKEKWQEANLVITIIIAWHEEMTGFINKALLNSPDQLDFYSKDETLFQKIKYLTRSESISRRGYESCCSENLDSTIADAEMCEKNLEEFSNLLYKFTKGFLY